VTPDSARLARGRNRVVMRDAMADRLSAATRARQTKAELSQVLLSAARSPDVEPHLALPNLTARGWLNRPEAAAILESVSRRGEGDAASTFWSLVGVEAWLAGAYR
ncbi:MAG: asparagine synthase-related protein, partial [Acidobacteriota bacterium]|nr:asparagine synthase-related protein [Acidobacteriota bacterium]